MADIDSIREFAINNLIKLPHPTQNREIELKEIGELTELLYRLLSHEVEESNLKRLKNNFEIGFDKVNSFNLIELPLAIETLATTFESFLRKIAYLKYGKTAIWLGDENYEGIKKSSLADLISSELPIKYNAAPGLTRKKYPEPLIDNTKVKGAILNFVREQLRNAIHQTKQYTRVELIKFSNYAVGVYYLAIDDNRDFLKKIFYPEFSYIAHLLENEELKRLNKFYIELSGVENMVDLDTMAIEKLDGEKLLASLQRIDETKEDSEDEDVIEPRVDTVINLSKSVDRFVIIGEPGSGKTTTLLKLQLEFATRFYLENSDKRLPVYIAANTFETTRSFYEIINSKLKFESLDTLQNKYKILILVDGLNEIENSLKKLAFNELKDLLANFKNVSFVFSSRSFAFYNFWGIPVFELTCINEAQIKEAINKLIGEKNGSNLWIEISNNNQLHHLCQNPLHLMMLIKIASLNQGRIPVNRGTLYKLFNDALFFREKKIYLSDVATKIQILSYLAFWMRKTGYFKRAKVSIVKEIIIERLPLLNKSVGVNELLYQLLDHNILSITDDDIEFLHETFQEYYIALEIKNQFYNNQSLPFDYGDEKWIESLLICSDLLNKEEEQNDFLNYLFVGSKTNLPKRISSFDKEDINEHFPVACKVAFKLKISYPGVYQKIENYLINYLVIWSLQKSKGIEITTFHKLIEGIAALSSEKIFGIFFSSVKYLYHWFYNPRYDKKKDRIFADINFELKFTEVNKRFIDNLSDFELVYSVVNNILKSNIYFASNSIPFNIKRFKIQLIQNAQKSDLLIAFSKLKSKELLVQIGLTDIDFVIEHYQDVRSFKLENLYDFLIKRHKNIRGRQFLYNSLYIEDIDFKIKIRILESLLFQPEYYLELLNLICNFIKNPAFEKYLERLRILLWALPLDTLKGYQLDVLYARPEVEDIEIAAEVLTIKRSLNKTKLRISNLEVERDLLLRSLVNLYFDGKKLNIEYDFEDSEIDNSKMMIVVESNDSINKSLQKEFIKGGMFAVKVGVNSYNTYDYRFLGIVFSKMSPNCLKRKSMGHPLRMIPGQSKRRILGQPQ
jgi:hypothetical protein